MGPVYCALAGAAFVLAAGLAGLCALALLLRSSLDGVRHAQEKDRRHGRRLVGFFHPHSTGGGGGERVLWTMLKALMAMWPEADFIVYTHWTKGGAATHEEVRRHVLEKFGIELQRPVSLVQLHGIKWVEPASYPRLTLLLQSLGALPLAWEALKARPPDVFIDTMGLALAYPLARLCGRCAVACYVHYPIVSSDMLSVVRDRKERFNNAGSVAHSRLLTSAKLLYYRVFAELYGLAGRQSDAVMVNGSWCKGHIMEVWRLPSRRVSRVYPPCDVAELLQLGGGEKESAVISVAQFRPEKDHPLQLRAFKLLVDGWAGGECPRLHLVGGVRNEEDRGRVEALREQAASLGLEDKVSFHIDLPYDDLKGLLDRCAVGLHTMWNEHFGIGVVEYMAAGCIPVAHNSGGPKMDIVAEGCGFLAETAEEYAAAMRQALAMPAKDLAAMRRRGKEHSQGFSEKAFADGVRSALSGL